jgi:hypothetical protein
MSQATPFLNDGEQRQKTNHLVDREGHPQIADPVSNSKFKVWGSVPMVMGPKLETAETMTLRTKPE